MRKLLIWFPSATLRINFKLTMSGWVLLRVRGSPPLDARLHGHDVREIELGKLQAFCEDGD